MQIILSSAKIINNKTSTSPETIPKYQNEANLIAMDMAQKKIEELAKLFQCNDKIASENWLRFQKFFVADKMPAILAYNGQAYKHLKARTFSKSEMLFAQQHLWITSFLYGLLRPLDAIVPYRMEQNVSLDITDNIPLKNYWRNILSDTLLKSVREDDGVIIHLTTQEYEHLFNWNIVKKEAQVIQPLFYTRIKGELKMQAVWAKTCRGAMTRYIIENKIKSIEDLKSFSYEGFIFNPDLGEQNYPHFIREEK